MPIYQDQDYNYNTNEFKSEKEIFRSRESSIKNEENSKFTAGYIDKNQ